MVIRVEQCAKFVAIPSMMPRNPQFVKQSTFPWFISNDIAQKEIVLNSLLIQHLIMITRISYEIIFTIALPKLIYIARLLTCVIRVTDSIRHYNTDYSGLEWTNIDTFWY